MEKRFDTDRSLKRITRAGFLSMLVFVGGFSAWSWFTELNGAVVAHATLVSESYTKKIQHRDGGIVQKILVRDGDLVKAGQELVLLDPTETKAELGIVQSLLSESLVKKARLEAQRDGLRAMTLPQEVEANKADADLAEIINGQQKLLVSTSDAVKGKRDQFDQQVSQLTEQIGGIDAQLESKKAQLKLINDELVNLRKLYQQGLVPVTRILQTEREVAQLTGEQGELFGQRASANGRIGEVKVQMIQLDEQNRNQALTDLREADAKIAELKERRISATARLSRMSIKAPTDGTIYQMSIHTEGGVISPGEALMLLVPEGDDLVLQAQVSPKDRPQIHTGQSAMIKFPSFNARTTPEVSGTITQIGADVTRVDAQTPPYYAVRLVISAAQLKLLGDNKLEPGMGAEAFIQTTARSPFSYLIKPLRDQIEHAWRET
jgi:HlyD family secretion protein